MLSVSLLGYSLIAILFSAFYTGGCEDTYVYDTDYYAFSNNGRIIVICEEAFLLGGWGRVYQIDNDNIAIEIGRFGTDDGHKNGGDYKIEWYDDYALIHYYDGNNMRCLEISLN